MGSIYGNDAVGDGGAGIDQDAQGNGDAGIDRDAPEDGDAGIDQNTPEDGDAGIDQNTPEDGDAGIDQDEGGGGDAQENSTSIDLLPESGWTLHGTKAEFRQEIQRAIDRGYETHAISFSLSEFDGDKVSGKHAYRVPPYPVTLYFGFYLQVTIPDGDGIEGLAFRYASPTSNYSSSYSECTHDAADMPFRQWSDITGQDMVVQINLGWSYSNAVLQSVSVSADLPSPQGNFLYLNYFRKDKTRYARTTFTLKYNVAAMQAWLDSP